MTVGVAATALLLAAGCSTGGGTNPSPSSSGSASGVSGSTTPAGLERFYQQKPDWQACGPAQCSWLEVPIDYANPGSGTIKLRMLKVPTTGAKKSGTLFINPGGPGGSAVEYASYADRVISPPVLAAYDVVGVDPRGVGQSNPVVCLDGPQTDTFLSTDPTPDDPAERDALVRESKRLGDACAQKFPDLIKHLSTQYVARDMDVARAVVGDPKMTYLGKSYGTYLGAVYAELFPDKVGRFVLDGAISTSLSNDELNRGQAEGFELATRAYVASCVKQPGCPLGTDVEAGMAKLRDFLAKLDANPLPVTNDRTVTKLTEGWGVLGLAQAMYSEDSWQFLTPALSSAMLDGDGSNLFGLSREYARRLDDGRYVGNLVQVISAVNCLDRGSSPMSDADREKLIADYKKTAPTWGRYMAWGSITCESWPVQGLKEPLRIEAKGSAPILVVGTTRDPATPYVWAQKLAKELANARLLTMNGDGHTAYMRANSCIDKAVDAYFLNGTLPAEGTTC
ncbi:MAG: alpha/beta fold hydrolase [Austwickia sp.]|nr:alpha/beta fold hydrolase [Austwickia sp.]